MHWGKRGPGSLSKRRRVFGPEAEPLEGRRLLATFDLSQTQTAPYGVEFVGKATNNTAGYKITDVGNVTGSGFDSFVISAPGLPFSTVGGRPDFANPQESASYLVIGSKQVNLTTIADYLTLANGVLSTTGGGLTSGNRGSDLGELGTTGVAALAGIANPTAQDNPTVTQAPLPLAASTYTYGFNFDGLTFVTGLDSTTGLGRSSGLGFSVSALGDLNGDGYDDFAISAPNDSGGGKVFIIYGGAALATQSVTSKTIDLEPVAGTTTTTAPTKVVSLSLLAGTTGNDVGYSVAGIGNYFNTTTGRDVAIGAPGLTVGGNVNAGAVFTVSGTYLNTLATGTNVDLTTIGNGSNTTGGIEYTGVSAGALTGTSVATAGNFDGQVGSGKPIDDLLIGAPGAGTGGQAYLVYANQTYLPNSTRGTTQSLSSLGVAATTNPVTNPLQGIVFSDAGSADRLGFAVASAGDFNADGVDDVLLGAPGYGASTGYAYVAYGLAGTTTTTPVRINGVFTITPTVATTGLTATSFIGQTIGDYTGYSLATTTHIVLPTSTGTAPEYDILIGAPGANFDAGEAYLVPGTATGATPLTVPQMLSNISTTLNGTLFNTQGTSDPAVITASSGFGTSVSARDPIIDANTNTTTVDNDSVPDLFIGAPYASLSNSSLGTAGTRITAGVSYVIEGGLIGGTSSTTTTTTTTTTGLLQSFPNAFGQLIPVVYTGIDNGLPYPPVSALEAKSSYEPLPVQIAYQQYLAQPGFLDREQLYHHPSQKGGAHQAPAGTVLTVQNIKRSENKYAKVNTLSYKVFDRGKFKVDKPKTYTHKVKVIPRSQKTESYPG